MFALLVVASIALPAVGQPSSRDVPTADSRLKAAEATAHIQQKNVLLLFGASWCSSCHRLQSFLADPVIAPIFDRYFVKLVVIHGEHPSDTRHQDTPGAEQLLDSLHDTNTTLPLMVVLSSNGKIIVDSVRPNYGPRNVYANIGYPEGRYSVEWFFEMLRRGAPSLTSTETETIGNWLRQHSDDNGAKPSLRR
jgi:thiol-disulfide isomerase/thioredoxin